MSKNLIKLSLLLSFLIFVVGLGYPLSFVKAQGCNSEDGVCPVNCSIGEDNDCQLEELGKNEMINSIGYYKSQYSPWVLHKPGWQSYIIYYCKNTVENGIGRDRVWRIENWDDGKFGDWVNDQIAVEGTMGEDDDLSCSPGVVIGQDGTWHMYYVTGNRNADGVLYLYHATAPPPGVNWSKRGKVDFQGMNQPFPGYLETPSPLLIGNKIILYFVGQQGKLFKAVSSDGFKFSQPKLLNAPSWVQAGRVTYKRGVYYYVYSLDPNYSHQPPTEIHLTVSDDGENFYNDQLIMFSNGSGWDGDRMWSPYLLKNGSEYRVYYAGNKGNYDWWGSNTSLGLRWFSEIRDCRDNDQVCPGSCSVKDDNDCSPVIRVKDILADYFFSSPKLDLSGDSFINGIDFGCLTN